MGGELGICIRVFTEGEEMKVATDIDLLAKKYPQANLKKFIPGHSYPMSELMGALGFVTGSPQGKPRGNTK